MSHATSRCDVKPQLKAFSILLIHASRAANFAADACPMNWHSLPSCQILTYIILTSGTVKDQAYRNSQGRTPPRHPLMDQLSHGVMP